MLRTAFAAIALSIVAAAANGQTLDGRLKKIASTKTVSIAYRADATPFSFTEDKQVLGFSIDLCKRVVASIERQVKVQPLTTKWVPVTTQTRFDAVSKGEADMECGSSTVTLSRLKQVDFSSYIFVETTGLMVKTAGGLRSLKDMAGKRIVAIGGTTNERAVNDQLKRLQIGATVVQAKSREDAIAMLEAGKADAFASDKLLLLGAALKSKDMQSLAILDDQLSFEPYGIALPRGDAAFRLAVNTGLSEIYRSGEIIEIFSRWFSGLGKPTAILEATYVLGMIPE